MNIEKVIKSLWITAIVIGFVVGAIATWAIISVVTGHVK
jgi:multisubunit Na+/H+ antiporter MnhC subunit